MGAGVPHPASSLLTTAGTGRFEPMILGEAERFSDDDLAAIRDALPAWSGAFSARCFNLVMQDWFARHASEAEGSTRQRRQARATARRQQARDDLRQIIDGITKATDAMRTLAERHDE